MWSAAHQRRDGLDLLLRRGANVNARTYEGMTALIYGADGEDPQVVSILLSGGANPNLRNVYGRTALMEAADAGRLDNVRLLLAYGADAEMRSWDGRGALHFAIRGGSWRVVRVLLEHRTASAADMRAELQEALQYAVTRRRQFERAGRIEELKRLDAIVDRLERGQLGSRNEPL
jgi:ankyrin repeat protein